ncbi:hypothetical protein [Azotobacter beijerinckii]|uniref:hypothetical protein n=1 Tax=Azotobacter beijerinckii TaxID=170623 RepID=UPI001428B508|nr:hypothetical protein [Azotobacter beijerinckii]
MDLQKGAGLNFREAAIFEQLSKEAGRKWRDFFRFSTQFFALSCYLKSIAECRKS